MGPTPRTTERDSDSPTTLEPDAAVKEEPDAASSTPQSEKGDTPDASAGSATPRRATKRLVGRGDSPMGSKARAAATPDREAFWAHTEACTRRVVRLWHR